jgi:hypothetical protein
VVLDNATGEVLHALPTQIFSKNNFDKKYLIIQNSSDNHYVYFLNDERSITFVYKITKPFIDVNSSLVLHDTLKGKNMGLPTVVGDSVCFANEGKLQFYTPKTRMKNTINLQVDIENNAEILAMGNKSLVIINSKKTIYLEKTTNNYISKTIEIAPFYTLSRNLDFCLTPSGSLFYFGERKLMGISPIVTTTQKNIKPIKMHHATIVGDKITLSGTHDENTNGIVIGKEIIFTSNFTLKYGASLQVKIQK